ncbi:MAG: hypothetical protein MUC48_06070 [Leptolyngbya sp. Prado105]|jgi:hypothetical protein|nr:hypothetical protein [Leptolyngbya sp. Prado105]
MHELISSEDFLKRKKVGESSFYVSEIGPSPPLPLDNSEESDPAIRITFDDRLTITPDEFLAQQGVTPEIAIRVRLDDEMQVTQSTAQTLVLYLLVLPIVIVPFWLMMQMSLLIFYLKPHLEKILLGFLGLLGLEILGILYILRLQLVQARLCLPYDRTRKH